MGAGRVQTPDDDLTYRIIGCAMAVHRQLGPGYREDTYQRDLETQFALEGLSYESQKNIAVYDSSQGAVFIGYYIPDFIVAERIVVEIKALAGLDNSHLAQVIGYLAVTQCPAGYWSTSAPAACSGDGCSHRRRSGSIRSIANGCSFRTG